MRKIFLIGVCVMSVLLASCAASTTENSGEYDERAIAQLDLLTETIGVLESVSFSVTTWVPGDVRLADVYFRGPDKMYVHSVGMESGFERGYWYDGSTLSFFSFVDNVYDTVDAPERTMEAIRFLNLEYGIEFPAADFFFPTLTDDIIENYDRVYYVGETTVDGVEAIEIEVSNDQEIVELWIDKETHLPLRMAISVAGDNEISFDTVISNWRLDPDLPDVMFEFDPPSDSERKPMRKIN